MNVTADANNFLSWGSAAIVAGAVLWVILQHGGGFGVSDTVLRIVVILLVSAGTFAVGLDTAWHNYPFNQTTQQAGTAWTLLD